MNKRGDTEIIINTRVLERAFWVLLVAVLIGLLVWRWDLGSIKDNTESLQKIAELEDELTQKEAQIASLTTQVEEASAPAQNSTKTQNTPPVQTNQTTQPSASNPNRALSLNWDYEASYPSTTTTKLEGVTVTVDNPRDTPIVFDFTICRINLECDKVFHEGQLTAPANKITNIPLVYSLPSIVDSRSTNSLRLVVKDGTTIVLSETKTVK